MLFPQLFGLGVLEKVSRTVQVIFPLLGSIAITFFPKSHVLFLGVVRRSGGGQGGTKMHRCKEFWTESRNLIACIIIRFIKFGAVIALLNNSSHQRHLQARLDPKQFHLMQSQAMPSVFHYENVKLLYEKQHARLHRFSASDDRCLFLCVSIVWTDFHLIQNTCFFKIGGIWNRFGLSSCIMPSPGKT